MPGAGGACRDDAEYVSFFDFSAVLMRGLPGGTAGAAWQRDSAAYDERRDSAARPVVGRPVAARPQKNGVPFRSARRIY